MLRDVLVALSLANLCFFSVWGDLLPGSQLHYYMAMSPPRVAHLAIVLNVLLFATLFWIVWIVANRSLSRRARSLGRLVFLVLVFLALNGMRIYAKDLAPEALSPLFIQSTFVSLAIGAIGIGVVLYWRTCLCRLAVMAVLIMSPLVFATFGQALWRFVYYRTTFGDFGDLVESAAPPPVLRQQPAPRVIWLLFDELDQQLAFTERPIGLELPEFDRFRNQAIYATNAYPVASETRQAMPALISGRRISNARPLNHSELLVTLADTHETVTWSSLPNLFTEARSSGFNTALIGYYHPYCRVLRNSLTTCSSWGAHFLVWKHSAVFTLPETMLNQIAQAVNAIPFARRAELPEKLLKQSGTIQAKRGELYVQFYLRMLDESKRVLTSRHDGLVLLHLPVPHVPFIYDRLTGQLVVEGSKSYLDNLALADRTLGELRRTMEEQGIWEDAAILVTSDHWYRNKRSESLAEHFAMRTLSDKRIPLLLKLPGQKQQVKYEATFNSIIIHDLLLALLTDTARFAHPEEIVKFLDTNRSIAPPLCEGWPLRLEKQAAAGCLDRLPEPSQKRESNNLSLIGE